MTYALELGFVALTDAAPLIVARERGLFAEEDLDVTLHREASWATIRDKVAAGLYQGAHMLAPLAIATRLGVGSEPAPLIASMPLNAHGGSIGVSAGLFGEMSGSDGAALKAAVAARYARGAPVISFAVVFPYSMHNYMLRYWLASAGIDPDRDIRIVVAPPTAIAARLKAGEIDGFCVGAPWGAVCETEGGARIVLEASEFWSNGPDKVLGLSQPWAESEANAALAVTRALTRAAMWADAPNNTAELARILARPDFVNAPADLIARALAPGATALRFASHTPLYRWRSHAAWIVSQMMRWGQVGRDVDIARALDCYRPDLFRAACADAGNSAALQDTRIAGAHAAPWATAESRGPIPMTANPFPDGATFDSDSIAAYAASFEITRLTG